MDKEEIVDPGVRHMREATLSIPPDHSLKVIYNVYKTSLETRLLASEAGRRIYPDALIENPKLGTLSHLSVRALAISPLPHTFLPSIAGDPLKMRIYYDNLSTNLRLEDCYWIEDEKYWHRVVLAKSRGKCLAYKQLNWKCMAISLKLAQRIESFSAEYSSEQELKQLAAKIKHFVYELHLSRLQSLNEAAFAEHIEAVLASVSGSETTSSSSSISVDTYSDNVPMTKKTEKEQEEWELDEGRRSTLRQEKLKHREEKVKMRTTEDTFDIAKSLASMATIKKRAKPKKPPLPNSVFEIELPPDEESVDRAMDRRNLQTLYKKTVLYNYPKEHCHHMSLRFLRNFNNLESLSIEFLGPTPDGKTRFHTRYFNCSTRDIERLAYGVSFLHRLKVFRLRNSRMDAGTIQILTKTLRELDLLETVDFGYDQLEDDCGEALYDLFQKTLTIKSLELEGNAIGVKTMQGLADAIAKYDGTLDYLGLAGTQLLEDGLHALNSRILGTEHIKFLRLTGATLSQKAIACCVAQELMQYHPPLRRLDICSISIGMEAANELLKSFQNNTKIILNYRGCGLSTEMEIEAEILVQRNRFIAENPFIGDYSWSIEEVDAYVSRIKNPILLRAWDTLAERKKCYLNYHHLMQKQREKEIEEEPPSRQDLDIPEYNVTMFGEERDSTFRDYMSVRGSFCKPFVFDPNNFDTEQFTKHVLYAPADERYRYFRNRLHGRSY